MAAAEYFSNTSMSQAALPSNRPSTSQPQAPASNMYIHQPIPQQPHQRPPPYEEHVHFAPSVVNIPQRHSFSHQQRPSQGSISQLQQHNHSPYSGSPQQTSHYSIGNVPNRYESPPQKPQYLTPHMRPYTNPNLSQYSLGNAGYVSDPEPQRRHKHRSRRDSGEDRSMNSSRSKSSSRSTHRDAFLGAAGGGLIGDLIFPGLGTVGGAALGWFGGKDYGKHRKGREGKRADDQVKWEKKYGSSDDRDRRRGSSEY